MAWNAVKLNDRLQPSCKTRITIQECFRHCETGLFGSRKTYNTLHTLFLLQILIFWECILWQCKKQVEANQSLMKEIDWTIETKKRKILNPDTLYPLSEMWVSHAFCASKLTDYGHNKLFAMKKFFSKNSEKWAITDRTRKWMYFKVALAHMKTKAIKNRAGQLGRYLNKNNMSLVFDWHDWCQWVSASYSK